MSDIRLAVPPTDTARNLDIRDVIGNKLDTHAGSSLLGHAVNSNEHFHTPCQVYPTLANGVAVGTGVGVWALSAAFVEIVPINTITLPFDIHWLCIEALSANDVFEIVLYAVEVEIGRVRVVKNAQQDGTMNIPFQDIIIPANAQIQAKSACAAGGESVTLSIFYHTY